MNKNITVFWYNEIVGYTDNTTVNHCNNDAVGMSKVSMYPDYQYSQYIFTLLGQADQLK